jgi:ankyrin repeat protein
VSQDNSAFLKKIIKKLKNEIDFPSTEVHFMKEKPFVKEMSGFTPLMIALVHGTEECLKTLIANGADVHKTDDNGNTILHIAATYRRIDNLKYFLKFHSVDAKLKNKNN